MDLTLTSTHPSYVARSTHLLNISSYILLPCTDSKVDQSKVHYKSSVEVDGYECDIRLYPGCSPWYQVELQLVFLGEAGANKVTSALSCRMVDPSGRFEPPEEKTSETTSFQHPSDSSQPLVVVSIFEAIDLPYFDSGSYSLTVECTVTVFRDLKAIPVPSSSSLHQHLGELLASQAGSDVTFTVSGESFPAHKNVLAVSSPVFMAEFFGEMQEKSSGRVEIQKMEAPVFGAMLRFIYTDAVPELDGKQEAAAAATTTLAQHLLVAADRYGLDRLKLQGDV
ncbi:BTB/POZ and MATH domain-containing protein 2-like [Miscanthus floridulus]|uniref:BTB/POZ and MATH domain-containing protein 2-like n=1 Tax=Miscanthus floridulus TaxID=154761 RepID=UPI00345B334B